MSESGNSTTYVLVHGAWSGAWALERLCKRLIARGHSVYAPTLSGLGERSHLADGDVTLSTHINDVVNEVLWKDLDRMVLVGHSYGGLVITGAVEKLQDRIQSIVYVDAFIPADGQSFADITGQKLAGKMTPPPQFPANAFANEADREWVARKATPQPTATFAEKLYITGAYQKVPRKGFVRASGWEGPFGAVASKLAADPTWTVREIACGHDVPNIRPDELANILIEFQS